MSRDTLIEYTIKPIKGREDLSEFKIKVALSELESDGIGRILIDEGYFKHLTYDYEWFTITNRQLLLS